MTACVSKGEKNAEQKSSTTMALQDSVSAGEIHRMQSSDTEVNIKFKGKDYRSRILRTPDETLPHVTNETGETYIDNKILLQLTSGDKSVFERTFTKKDFASAVDSAFLSKAILEGIVYDKVTSEGFVYAASVCYPNTDLYVPLSITVFPNGKIDIKQLDTLEEDYEEGASK